MSLQANLTDQQLLTALAVRHQRQAAVLFDA